ncbi:MAG TPA: hypothetical protein VLL05_18515 [Terriglobales bacterium]|nr:hypothetical protein [Terriglobales bacterium]
MTSFRMACVFPKSSLWIPVLCLMSAGMLVAQQPPVKVNVLNVCSPSQEEQKEISSALARVPKQAIFSQDFEVARGRSSLSEAPGLLQAGQSAQLSDEPSIARWVRLRRDFSVQAMFSTVQYSFSDDGKNMVETLVLHVRDPKDLVQLSIEDSATSVTSPAAMLGTSSAASRIKLERFGKSSVVLARCAGSEGGTPPDQSAYEPLFTSASSIMTNYRALLNARSTVPAELTRVLGEGKPSEKKTPGKHRSTAKKP